MAEDRGYVMGKADAASESGRLELLEACRDPGTIGRLQRLGVADGWRCLEVGAGRGSIARWLAEQVSPAGSVVAVDIDPRFLTGLPDNVEVRTLDIREHEVEPGTYDLVHCRALLMHLPDPAGTIGRLAAALRPGGTLLAEEGDYGLYHYGGHPDAEVLTDRAHRALDVATAAGVVNARFGRTLPAMLSESGLALGGCEIETRIAKPGDPHYEFARVTTLQSLSPLLAAGVLDDVDAERLEGYFGEPGTVITTPTVVAAWAQKGA